MAEVRLVPVSVAAPEPGHVVACEADGVPLALCNVAGALHAIEDRCPHGFARLSDGRLEGAVLECPLHGGKLDVRSGEPARPPIRRPVRTFAVRRDGDQLRVEVPDA